MLLHYNEKLYFFFLNSIISIGTSLRPALNLNPILNLNQHQQPLLQSWAPADPISFQRPCHSTENEKVNIVPNINFNHCNFSYNLSYEKIFYEFASLGLVNQEPHTNNVHRIRRKLKQS